MGPTGLRNNIRGLALVLLYRIYILLVSIFSILNMFLELTCQTIIVAFTIKLRKHHEPYNYFERSVPSRRMCNDN